MSFRTLIIESESKLHLKLDNLVVKKNDEEIYVPIKDLSIIVLNNPMMLVTTRLLECLAQNNVGVIICDSNHLPIGIYTALNNHSRAVKMNNKQINFSEESKAILWQAIVRSKILNQSILLKKKHGESDNLTKMYKYISNVELYDSTNREGHAAKVYFNSMFGKLFSRDNENYIINSALNYGYAIVRATLARICVSYGLNTMIGVFHKSEYNQFNLCDDLIEPFRPFVDMYAMKIMENEKYLTYEIRKKLINIINLRINYRNKIMYINNVLEKFVQSYCKFLETGNIDNVYFPILEKLISGSSEV